MPNTPSPMALLAAVLAAMLLPARGGAQPPGGMPPARVGVAEVVQRRLNLGQTFVGTVVPLRRSVVGSPVEGRVEKLLVDEGDRVAEKQPLAQLRTVSLELELDGAKAELALRRQELAELEVSAPKQIAQAKARMESAQALMAFNEKRLERFQELFDKNALSSDELEEQAYNLEAAKKSHEELSAAWELAESGFWDAKIEQARARVEVQDATISKLDDDIRLHTITAPFDGYVTNKDTEVGQWVTAGSPVVDVVQIDTVDVEVPVLERYVPRLRVGSTARVEIEALPGRTWTGRVALIVPEADVRSRSFPVKVRLANEPEEHGTGQQGMLIEPGMFARVTLPVGRKDAALMVPKDALVLSSSKPVVWVVQETPDVPNQGTATPVPVELGVSYGSLIEVRGPLEPGQWVVVEGNERIRPMQPLILTKVLPPEAPPPDPPLPKAAAAAPKGLPATSSGGAPAE